MTDVVVCLVEVLGQFLRENCHKCLIVLCVIETIRENPVTDTTQCHKNEIVIRFVQCMPGGTASVAPVSVSPGRLPGAKLQSSVGLNFSHSIKEKDT